MAPSGEQWAYLRIGVHLQTHILTPLMAKVSRRQDREEGGALMRFANLSQAAKISVVSSENRSQCIVCSNSMKLGAAASFTELLLSTITASPGVVR